jgi:hypothetical protein
VKSTTYTFKIFGITIFSWKQSVDAPPPPEIDTEKLYQDFAERFEREHKEAWAKDLASELGEAVAKLRSGAGR